MSVFALAAGMAVMSVVTSGSQRALASAPAAVVSTVAGGVGGPATATTISQTPAGLAVRGGVLYIADTMLAGVRKVDIATRTETLLAGTGDTHSIGGCDAGSSPAESKMRYPTGIAVKSDGTVIVPTNNLTNSPVCAISPNGAVTTAGGSGSNNPGNGGLFSNAHLVAVAGAATDAADNLYFSDGASFDVSNRIRKVTPSGIITTVAGNGSTGFAGDGGPATSAKLNNPRGVVADGSGNVYFADSDNNRVRKIASNGTISTVAGDGTKGFGGDGAAATSAQLDSPDGVALTDSGELLVADTGNNRVRKIALNGVITTVAGTGSPGTAGDGGPANSASLTPSALTQSAGKVFVADGNRVRQFAVGGTISTIAGNGAAWYSGDGGAATNTQMTPTDVALASNGDAYVVDSDNGVIRRISGGIATTFAGGGGLVGKASDGGPATAAHLYPGGIAVDGNDNLLIADSESDLVRSITPGGTISTFAGTGSPGFSGDNGQAKAAQLQDPIDVAIGAAGTVYISDSGNARIRAVNSAGVISTFAGNGSPGNSGDNGPATAASIDPALIAADPAGVVYLSQSSSLGNIRKIIGGKIYNFASPLVCVAGLALDPASALLVSGSCGSSRIDRYLPDGTTANLGSGTGFYGDGGPVSTAGFQRPAGMTVAPSGDIFIADAGNRRLRKVNALTVPDSPPAPFLMASDRQITVDMQAPVSDGGIAITTYRATASPGGAFCTATPSVPECVITGLTNGTQYSVTAVAVNQLGSSAPSPASLATPATVPGAPTAVAAVAGNAQATVSWAAPASNGGSAIGAYVVTSNPGGKVCGWTTGPLSCTVTGLTNGTPYTFTVRASNIIGQGAVSAPSAAVTPSVTAPGAPASVTASAGKLAATVSWSSPSSNGGAAITGYTVTSSPDNKTCVWLSGPLSCTVGGLSAGVSYSFTVKATNAVGTGPPSAASSLVVPWDGSGFHPVAPSRVLDSRGPTGGWNAKLVAGSPRDLQVTGLGGASNVPATASAVVMNVTVTGASAGSFVSVWPTGSPQPSSSNLNFGAGQTIPNLVTAKIGTGGKVRFANAAGSVDVIADVVGYYDDGTGPGDLFNGITPTRLLDSRGPTGGWNAKLMSGTPKDLVVAQPGNTSGVPATATAVIANVTVTGGTAGSFVSVWPSGVAQPNVSNLNFGAGETIPNLVIVKVGAGGKISFANAVGGVDVILDVVGYFDPTAGSRFHAINPTRILDDRVGQGLSGAWGPNQTRALPVAGVAGTNVPVGATGLVANVTATNGTAGSFVTLYPDGVARPNSSNLNFGPGQTIPNLVAVKLPANGKIDLYNALGTVDLIADTVGYYAAT